ncbi:MAG: hypothetical protein FWH14_03620 [Oscillospiraceae bacterium]|nr:hypothetical protein [Oscillospiraceae bacterium]
MEDLANKIQELLGSEDGMAKIQSVAQMFGAGSGGSGAEGNGLDLSALSGLLGGSGGEQTEEKPSGGIPDLGGIDINMLMNIQKIMSAMNSDDKNIHLIKALKPHLSDDRRKKADDAMKIMQLISLLPMLKESGLFGNLLGGMTDGK